MKFKMLLAILFLPLLASAQTYTFSTLVSFPPSANKGPNDPGPFAPLVIDAAGNLYGYNFNTHSSDEGDGIIYKLTPDGAFSIVYTFCSLSNCADGSIPSGSLIFDMSGNAYGVTSLGGAFNLGTVFKLTPEGVESVLFSFPGGSNGEVPVFKLTQDAAGTMYGTALGGASNSGILFAITPAGEFSVFYSFACLPENCAVDPQSLSPLTLDSGGNLYGTYILNVGTQVQEIFKVTPAGAESVLYTFCQSENCTDGNHPFAPSFRWTPRATLMAPRD